MVRFLHEQPEYFDKDGIIVESTSETLPGVPKIAGLSFGHIVLHQPLPVEDISVFNEILNLTAGTVGQRGCGGRDPF